MAHAGTHCSRLLKAVGTSVTPKAVAAIATAATALVASATETTLWQCDFEDSTYGYGTNWDGIIASHLVFVGKTSCELNGYWSGSNGNYGDFLASDGHGSIDSSRVWISANETAAGKIAAPVIPGKWQAVAISFTPGPIIPASPVDEPFGDILSALAEAPSSSNAVQTVPPPAGLLLYARPGASVNIDDKLALRYTYTTDYDYSADWFVIAGHEDSDGRMTESAIRIIAAEDGQCLPSPENSWIVCEIEAANDGSPHGLAFRIRVGGKLAKAVETGDTVFRASPSAALDKNAVYALGIGGETFMDDIRFCIRDVDPLEFISVQTPEGVSLSAAEKANLSKVIGSTSGFDELWGASTARFLPDQGEPNDTPRICAQLGVSPAVIQTPQGEPSVRELLFKSPSLIAIGIDPAARIVSGRILPASGTHIAQPPCEAVFGLVQIQALGSGQRQSVDYGQQIANGTGGFSLDISQYLTSNGVFSIAYPAAIADYPSSFFSLAVRSYSGE